MYAWQRQPPRSFSFSGQLAHGSFIQPVPRPWYDNYLTEFFSENLVPWTIRDEREFAYQLQPATVPPSEELDARAENAHTLLRVRDTGPGIPAPHLSRVFDRFYKADASRTGTETPSGSGLGLSIVKAIVERHGGTVTARNVEDGGALFEIELPRRS